MKTETQQDSEVRIVALANLRAMCEYISSPMTHRFKIEKVTRSRVHVSYTGPYFDEFGYEGNDVHVVAVFPCYPSAYSVPHHSHTLILEDGTEEDVTLDDTKNPRVVLDILRILYEDEERDI